MKVVVSIPFSLRGMVICRWRVAAFLCLTVLAINAVRVTLGV